MQALLPYLFMTALALSASGCTPSCLCSPQPLVTPPVIHIIRHGRYTLEDLVPQPTSQAPQLQSHLARPAV